MSQHQVVEVSVNGVALLFEPPEQTGRSIKERAGIPDDHILCLDTKGTRPLEGDGYAPHRSTDELVVIEDDEAVILEHGRHFLSHTPEHSRGVTVTINGKPFEFDDPRQTGRSIKQRAAIPMADVLFLDRPVEDEVIGDDRKIVVKCGDCFHSSPPANYGGPLRLEAADVGCTRFETLPQSGGWTFLIVPEFALPDVFTPRAARLLVKLPPLFPEAAPDMFWLSPPVRTAAGGTPQGTSVETLLGAQWQRFSWHLAQGAWRAGASTLRDYMRCVRARIEKRN